MLKKRNKKGQSTLEYIILITAIIVVVIAVLVAPTSPFKTTMNNTFNAAIGKVGNMTDRWNNGV